LIEANALPLSQTANQAKPPCVLYLPGSTASSAKTGVTSQHSGLLTAQILWANAVDGKFHHITINGEVATRREAACIVPVRDTDQA